MKTKIIEFQEKFEEIKKMGWIQSVCKGYGGVGITFEKLLGRDENSLEIPDYNGIEIKTKRIYSKYCISLFSMTPWGKFYHEVERLKDSYGYPDSTFKKFKVLRSAVFANKLSRVGIFYFFQLEVNRKEKKIYLCIFDIQGNLIEKDVYWDFDIIKEKLYRKLNILAFIVAKNKTINETEYFKYISLKIYLLKDFNTFIYLIEQGIIRITFNIGIYKSEKKKGQILDHGTTFEISEIDLSKLFTLYKDIF